MNEITVQQAFDDLFTWCRERDFAGWDPFDALNSDVFRATPLSDSRIARLAFTQLLKRSPFNLRRFARVPPQHNAKGIALFALAALSNYRRTQTDEAAAEARQLLARLLELRIEGYSGAAWGYNFDWQSRNFFAPRGTPTVVPTAFAVRALTEGFEAFHDDHYLEVARSACEFVLGDLRRSVDTSDEVCFSYSPVDETQIFNASLLAAEVLVSVGRLTGDERFCDFGRRAALFVARRRQPSGSWAYGTDASQSWTDNFHTAYVLLSLSKIIKACGDPLGELLPALQRGSAYWRETFFLADGWPKYYDDALYPVDIHAAASAIVTLSELSETNPSLLTLAQRVGSWTISNLRDAQGYFYYQRRRAYVIRTPFMRWSQAWMLYALARLLETGDVSREL